MNVAGGVFALALGEGENPMDATALGGPGQTAWVGVTIGADPELERAPLRPVPHAVYAAHAAEAAKLQCSGCVGSAELADGAVVAAKLAKGAVGGDALAAGAVTAQHVAFACAGQRQVELGDDLFDGPVAHHGHPDDDPDDLLGRQPALAQRRHPGRTERGRNPIDRQVAREVEECGRVAFRDEFEFCLDGHGRHPQRLGGWPLGALGDLADQV